MKAAIALCVAFCATAIVAAIIIITLKIAFRARH